MRLLSMNSDVLRTPCAPFNFADPPFDPVAYAKELAKLMLDSNGIGLSANQTASDFDTSPEHRFAVFALAAEPNIVCYNPRVVHWGSEQVLLEEGCLSFPGLIVKVSRPRDVRVRYQTPNGETESRFLTGMTARAFQHELDHLSGVLFFDRASRMNRDRAMRRWDRSRQSGKLS